jgi:hypothetical protein
VRRVTSASDANSEPKEYTVSTERDDNSVEHSDESVAGTAHRPQRHDTQAGPADDPGDPRRPARGSRLTVGVVAAAVLLAGGGGAYWASASGGGGAAHGRPAPLVINGVDLPAKESAAVGSSAMAAGDGTYQLTGTLPKGPKTAAVYRADQQVSQAQVQRLAGLLGLHGPVTSDAASWRVRAAGSGPSLLVSRAAPGEWQYTRSGAGQMDSQPGRSPAGSVSSPVQPSAPAAPPQPVGPGDSGSSTGNAGPADSGTPPVSAEKAGAVAAPLLDGLGLSGARTDTAETVGAQRMVTADPVVDGLPTTGWATTLEVGPDGTLSTAGGRLASLTKGDTYPVVSAQTAFKQLSAPTVGLGSDNGLPACMVPLRPEQPAAPATPGQGTKPAQGNKLARTLPCVPGSGHPVQVRGAAFGLAFRYVSGAPALVPSWLFATAPAGVARTMVTAETAVDPAYIEGGSSASSAPPPGSVDPGGPMQPGPAPSAQPGGPTPSAVSPYPVDPQPAAPRVKVSGYQAVGSTLDVVFYGGICNPYKVTAVETASEVRVTVTAVSSGSQHKMCPMIARGFTQKVQLKQPLGSRTVVDASDGQPVRGQ